MTLLGEFGAPAEATPVSCGFDPTTDRVWVYAAFSASLTSFSRSGTLLGTVTRPGEAAVVGDISFASTNLTLDATLVPAGTLLFVNGETGVAEVHAVHTTGTVTATLPTAFGMSQVVGGSYHPARGTFFLLQDFLPPGTANDNLVAEIHPSTGSVLGSFSTSVAAGFPVDFGDVEVGANGNLFVVSSAQTSILEVTPTGTVVQQLTLPAGVSSLSGLAIDHARGEGWVTGTGGSVWRLGGFPIAVPRPALLASKGTSGAAVLSWASITSGVSAYDVVRGDLGILRQSLERFAQATTGCLVNNATAPPITDAAPLAPGAARWYLVRAVTGGGAGTYDDGSPSQVASRDPGIASSGAGCP